MAKKKKNKGVGLGTILLIGAGLYFLTKSNTVPAPTNDPVPQIPPTNNEPAVQGRRKGQRYFPVS